MRVDFQGSRVTSDGGLLVVRELDERLGLGELIERHLCDSRGKNTGLLDQMQIIWEQAEQAIGLTKKDEAATEGYMTEVIDPLAQAKLKEVPGSFVIKTPRRRE